MKICMNLLTVKPVSQCIRYNRPPLTNSLRGQTNQCRHFLVCKRSYRKVEDHNEEGFEGKLLQTQNAVSQYFSELLAGVALPNVAVS